MSPPKFPIGFSMSITFDNDSKYLFYFYLGEGEKNKQTKKHGKQFPVLISVHAYEN